MPYVYLIENRNNSKKYVGITKHSIEERFAGHKSESRVNQSRRLYQAMNKHGVESFTCVLIEECGDENVFERERYWIAFYKSNQYQFGYNMTTGGEGCVDRELSEDTIKKLRISVSKHRKSLSSEERKSLTNEANKAKRGFVESEKSRALKSKAQKNRFSKMTDEQRKLHGAISKQGVSEIGKIKQTIAMNEAFSPVRQKGYKQSLTFCPHCGKLGGVSAMKRHHMDNCKNRRLSD
jgi:group I intron endonuclease